MDGQCLCGAVRFHGEPEARGITVCHCGQCRRWGGGAPFVSVHFTGGVALDDDGALVWFRSSDRGERGFCARCGASLFWRVPGEASDFAVSVAALPEDHGLTIARHIWVDDKPGWYDYADDAPRLTAAQAMAGE